MRETLEHKNEISLIKVRQRIYFMIKKFSGIHFRELQRVLDMGSGNLEYHLNRLEKSHLIKVEKYRAKKRFYTLDLNDYERKILGVLRQQKFRSIILKLLNEECVIHKSIVTYLKISPSSVTWYLNRLISLNILVVTKKGRNKYYQLKNKDDIIKILITYKESFVDKLVDKFVDAWES